MTSEQQEQAGFLPLTLCGRLWRRLLGISSLHWSTWISTQSRISMYRWGNQPHRLSGERRTAYLLSGNTQLLIEDGSEVVR